MYELSWPDLEVGFQSLLPPLTFSLCPLSGAHGWKRELGKFRKSEGMLPRAGRWKREPPPPPHQMSTLCSTGRGCADVNGFLGCTGHPMSMVPWCMHMGTVSSQPDLTANRFHCIPLTFSAIELIVINTLIHRAESTDKVHQVDGAVTPCCHRHT